MLGSERHRITESIEIAAPVENVFGFLSDIESRMRLSPSYELVQFENLTGGGIGKGTKYRIKLMSEGRTGEYVGQVARFAENKKIVTREVEGRILLTLKLEETPKGTLLIHDEEFVIPRELIAPDEPVKEKEVGSFVQEIAEGIKELSKFVFGDPEDLRKIEQIKTNLRAALREWLRRIKATVEER